MATSRVPTVNEAGEVDFDVLPPVVLTVNDTAPDEDGNVEVDGGAGLGADGRLSTTAAPVATAAYPLRVPTPDGLPGVGHPDVLHIPGGFAGYTYWMGYTPLPGTPRELPCIAASNDGITWVTPSAACLPIATYAEAQALYTAAGWWSDTDLVLSPDGTTLMLYFRGTQPGVTNDLWVATSTDGLVWNKSKIMTGGASESHAVIVEPDGSFTQFSVDTSNVKILRRTSADGLTWSAATPSTSIPALPAPYALWHMDVCKVGTTYHALIMTTTPNSRTQPFRLFHWTSTNGLDWVGDITPSVPLTGGRYDFQGNYRSSIQPAASGREGRFDLWLHMIDDTRTSNHTAAVARLGVIRDFDFSSRETWAFTPVQPLQELTPLEGDQMYVMPSQMMVHTGTPTLVLIGDTPVWKMLVDEYVTFSIPRLPQGWHRFAMDVLVLADIALDSGQAVTPTISLQGYIAFTRPGQQMGASTTVGSGTGGSVVTANMTAVQYDSVWVRDLFDGSQSALDVRRDGILSIKLRRRGSAGSTFKAGSTVLPLHVAGVRLRRI